MILAITPNEIHLPPGAVVRFPGSWQDYRALVEQLGDRAIPRIKYRTGEILLMSPLPQHGRQANIIADVVKALLDYLERDYEAFTPITMELPEESGIEPDYCFYIEHWEAVVGKDRIDWSADPPPDLAIEIDVTSYTDLNDYFPYRVPEVWLFKSNKLTVYQLQGERYVIQPSSRYFSSFNVADLVAECLQIARERGTSAAVRSLRRKLKSE